MDGQRLFCIGLNVSDGPSRKEKRLQHLKRFYQQSLSAGRIYIYWPYRSPYGDFVIRNNSSIFGITIFSITEQLAVSSFHPSPFSSSFLGQSYTFSIYNNLSLLIPSCLHVITSSTSLLNSFSPSPPTFAVFSILRTSSQMNSFFLSFYPSSTKNFGKNSFSIILYLASFFSSRLVSSFLKEIILLEMKMKRITS